VLILALDTSSPAGSVAVLRDGKVLGVVSTWADEIYSSRIFRHIEFILKELGIGLEQIDVFAVAAGPGSFTGLRVGLTAAKGWAEVYGKPIAAVSALQAVAEQSHSAAPLIAPVLDARRSQVYYGFYRATSGPNGRTLDLDGDECVATPAEFLTLLQSRALPLVTVATPVPELISQVLSSSQVADSPYERVTIEQVSTVLAPAIGQLGYLQAQRGELVDALTLNANYVRRSDAELQWKALKVP
jgi:tRNA threonylcarbamoyladenosine biosynthesis protein TsaB